MWIIGLFSITLVLNGIFIYYIHNRNYTYIIRWRMQAVLFQIKENLAEYDALPWLLNYWKTKGSGMELPGDPGKRGTLLQKLLLSEETESLKKITDTQAKGFSPEEQKAFAEASYLSILPQFDSFKISFRLGELNCVALQDNGEAIPLFQGKSKEERALLESYSTLRENWPFNAALHPAVAEMYETKKERAYFEEIQSTTDGKNYLFTYVPIVENGDISCHIGAAYVMDDVQRIVLTGTRLSECINAALLLSCGLILLLFLYFKVLKPLSSITEYVEEYTRKKNIMEIIPKLASVQSGNELERLSDNFSDMIIETEQFALERQRVAVERERAAAELSFAANIQTGSIPDDFSLFSERNDVDLYASMTPAKTVGGDFYDFFFLDEDHLYMTIADVSGKGIPAAMFMMVSKYILKSLALEGKSPGRILEEANTTICANNKEQMFVTVWVGILELSSGKLTAANAGHERPAVCKDGGAFELLKDPHGLVLGRIEGMKYEEYEIALDPGSVLFVFTDGVVEATNKSEELFGKQRMLDALNRAKDLPPKSLLSEILGSVNAFVGRAEQFDELTMLCLKYQK